MNPQITNLSKTIADNYSTNAERVLDIVLDTNRKVVETTITTLDQLIDQLPAMPSQLGDRLPTPAEAGARYLDFVERAVEVNREWNERIVAMLADAPKNVDHVAAKTAAAATAAGDSVTAVAKTIAKKAPAKKAPAKKAPAKKVAAKKVTAKKAPAKKAAAKRSTSAK